MNTKNFICPICKKRDFILIYPANIGKNFFEKLYKISGTEYGKHLDIFQCQNCGIIFEKSDEIKKKLISYYSHFHDQEYEDECENRAITFRKIISTIEEKKSSGNLLDIGCATGMFLAEAKNRGYEVYGVEPSSWAAKIAKEKHHLNVSIDNIEKLCLPENFFDIITLIDTIEHFYNPQGVFQKISHVIKKGGLLCIVTPNIKSIVAKILKDRWWHIRPSHLFYFSPKTVDYLLKKWNFEIISVKQYEWHFSVLYLLQRLLKLFSIENIIRAKWLKKIVLPVNLRDSMEIYAIKK